MKKDKITCTSAYLNRPMNILVYGNEGTPILAFPNGRGKAIAWENAGMVTMLSADIESGKIQLFCVDAVDEDSWLDIYSKPEVREQILENYYLYIIKEALPSIREYRGADVFPIAIGFDTGANNAAIAVMRRPYLFSGLLACSGCYDASYYFNHNCTDTLYNNSPALFMERMPLEHNYVSIYNKKKLVFCVGQNSVEKEAQRTANMLKCSFNDRNINAWVDFWGADVLPDWDWWKKQVAYFLPWLLDPNRK